MKPRHKMDHADETLQAIFIYWREFFQPPTIDQLVNLTGCTTKSHTFKILRQLQSEGKIILVKGKAIPLEIQRRIQGG